MVTLRLFAVLVGFGASIGLWRLYLRAEPGSKFWGVAVGLTALLGGLAGARAGYVLMHLAYYQAHSDLTLKLWQGGLNAYGFILGALLFTLATALITRKSCFTALDLVSLLLAPLGVAVWVGLWSEGVAYGQAVSPGMTWGLMAPDESGALLRRFPLQFIAALSLWGVLLLAERVTRAAKPGVRAGTLWLVLALHTLLMTVFRADYTRELFGLRLDIAFGLVLSLAFTIFLLAITLYWKKNGDKIKPGSGTKNVIEEDA